MKITVMDISILVRIGTGEKNFSRAEIGLAGRERQRLSAIAQVRADSLEAFAKRVCLGGIEHNIGFRMARSSGKLHGGGRQSVGIHTGNSGDPEFACDGRQLKALNAQLRGEGAVEEIASASQ